jgi:hypothetical protein
MEIKVTDANVMDEISIRTQHSQYNFRVTDPNGCRGVLTGGELGIQQCEAVFSGAIFPTTFRRSSCDGFEIGTRALFYLSINGGVKVLTTSTIIHLAFYVSGEQETQAR